MLKKFCIIDLDGTLADNRHRANISDWDEYHSMADYDRINRDVSALFVRWQDAGGQVIILSSRPAKEIERTRRWLADIMLEPEVLILRPDKNFMGDAELKVALIDDYFKSRENALENVAFVLDDNDKVITEFRNAGFRAWHVG